MEGDSYSYGYLEEQKLEEDVLVLPLEERAYLAQFDDVVDQHCGEGEEKYRVGCVVEVAYDLDKVLFLDVKRSREDKHESCYGHDASEDEKYSTLFFSLGI